MTVRIVLADDHPVVRGGLRALLATIDGFEVVGEAADGEAAVREAQLLHPDVVLMDVRMPGLGGVEATRRIREATPDTAVLMLTMYDDDATVLTAMQAGARGYLLKGAEQDEIVGAIRAVVAGQVIFGPGIAGRVLDYFSAPPVPAAEPFPELTDRERDILDLLASGLRTAAIAERSVPLAQDGQQPPDERVRQARGRRPGGGHPPSTRGRARPGSGERRDRRRGCCQPRRRRGVACGQRALILRSRQPSGPGHCSRWPDCCSSALSCSRPRATTTPRRSLLAARRCIGRPARAGQLPEHRLAPWHAPPGGFDGRGSGGCRVAGDCLVDQPGVVGLIAMVSGLVLIAYVWWRIEVGAARRALVAGLDVARRVRQRAGVRLHVVLGTERPGRNRRPRSVLVVIGPAMYVGVARPEVVDVRGLVVHARCLRVRRGRHTSPRS